jgi:uncharacterized phage protein (TIGR01671 family)
MDREILFRGKRLNNGEWVCGNLIQMDSEGSQSFIFPFYKYASSLTCGQIVSMFMVAVDPATVGQFTGLTDKNGVKIFEGDILKTYTQTVQIIWSENGYTLLALADDNFPYWLGREFSAFEVIGNIHDTKEEESE